MRCRWALLLFALTLGACGYSTGSLMPAGVHSVAVPIARNDTWYRHAEITLTREMTDQFLRHSTVDLRDAGSADALLRTRIVSIPRFTLIEDDRDRNLESGVLVEVEYWLESARDGSVIVPVNVVRRRAESIQPRGETLQGAVDEALIEAARDIVIQIQAQEFLRSRTVP